MFLLHALHSVLEPAAVVGRCFECADSVAWAGPIKGAKHAP
jgi:hypothetical protein